ncbi:MAG: 4Fe-4S ferredoxin [Nitrospirae bacterium GWC1_57_7]|nr:MAG: 4Fe-4S ferredoxin [Nitrospirae bacterium GWC1_57_7]
MSTVYFSSARTLRWDYHHSVAGKLETLLERLDFGSRFTNDDWVAIKTHWGSQGAFRIVPPSFLRKVVNAVKQTGAGPFVTDTVRIMGLDYLEVANQNGLNHLSCGAPVVLADGLYGKDSILVKAGPLLGSLAVASAIHDAPAMIVCSHVKGHINSGYAGAIKNLAMGCVSSRHRDQGWQKGRGSMHCHGEMGLQWNAEVCTFCEQCANICPLHSIKFKEGAFSYDHDACWHCGRCSRVCQEGALTLPQDDETFQKSLAEAAAAVLSTFDRRKVVYVNFLLQVQPECDCMPVADVPVIQDQGIMVSDDLAAIEQASLDMLRSCPPLPQSAADEAGIKAGDDVLFKINPRPARLQIEEAERLGLGTRKYELVRVEP